MNLKLLITDKCFFAVLAVMMVLIVNGLRHTPNRIAFRHIFSKSVSASSGILLLFFLSIGILDSIHFSDSQSLLDKLISPVGEVYEKTYSAPLSLNLYSSEIRTQNGITEMVYPRLQQISSILQSKEDSHKFIQRVIIKAFIWSVLSAGLLWLLTAIFSKRFIPTSPELSSIITFAVGIFFILASYWLSRHLHVLGTGKIGQDIYYATVKSIRTGLIIGMLTTLFMMPLALLLGVAAGYFGGLIDDFIQYIYTTLSSIPGVLLITASVLSMQTFIANHPEYFTTLNESADARLLALCIILGITSWTGLCRLLRAEALKLKEIDYVSAAKALGSSSFYILTKHLLPNVMHIVIITFVLDFSYLVLAEAVLSYVGIGVSPLTISWGNMINAGRLELAREPIVWWPMFAAFIFMFTLVLASNLFADAVEEAYNPRKER